MVNAYVSYRVSNEKECLQRKVNEFMFANVLADSDSYSEWRNYDNLFKILIIGNSAVGKTAFLTRFTDDVFTSGFCSTIGIDFRIKTVHKGGRKIKLQVPRPASA